MALRGTPFVATKPVLTGVPPLTLALPRFVVALAVLLPVTSRRGGRPALERGAACGAAYTILGRCRFNGNNALALTTGSMLYGALFLLPAAVLESVLGAAPRSMPR